MEDIKKKLTGLLNNDEWTTEDKQWLMDYLEHTDSTELRSLMYEEFSNNETTLGKDLANELLANIHSRIGIVVPAPAKTFSLLTFFKKNIAAAAVIAMCIAGAYLLAQDHRNGTIAGKDHRQPVTTNKPGNGLPASNKAVLTLADGATIVLDDAHDGTLTQQGETKVFKAGGSIRYQGPGGADGSNMYNSISTPRGGEYQVVLADGSRVWLNAASSIHFPASFTGDERRVEITGEAYFEVAKNASKPFIVKVNDSEIKVLGTHFNVMAYNDESSVKTTLLEGSVLVNHGNRQARLRPGQQSELVGDGEIKVVSDVPVDDVVAWKNGYFNFKKTEVATMMRQLSRWYNFEVRYDGNKNYELFVAEFPRDMTLSQALQALETTGKIKFGLQGNTVIVK